MSIEATLGTIAELTQELGATYELQAELVSAELDAQEAVIGAFKKWRCTAWLCTTGGYSSDSEPGGWTKALHWPNLEENDHPDQGEARAAVSDAAQEYNTTDVDQMDQKEELSTIPTDLGSFLVDWFEIDNTFSNIYYPANTNEVPASGQGWLSSASSGYDSAVGTQRSAADTAREVVGGLISNSSTFLTDITDTMGTLTSLALTQEQNYLNALTALAQDYSSIGGYISAAKEIVQLFKDERDLYYQRVNEQGRQLAAAVNSVIQVGLLENDLNGIGPGGNWPDPQNVSTDADQPGTPARDEIITDAAWFKSHIDFWDDIESDMTSLKTSADGAAVLPIKIIKLPHFSAVQSTALNGLADKLTAAIGGGQTSAGKVSDGLTTSIRNYIENEIGAGAEADAFFNQHVGG